MKILGLLTAGAVGLIAGNVIGRLTATKDDEHLVDVPDLPEPLVNYLEGLFSHDPDLVWENQSKQLISAMSAMKPPITKEVFKKGFTAGFENYTFENPEVLFGYWSGKKGYWCVTVMVRVGEEAAERVYVVTTDEEGFVINIYS